MWARGRGIRWLMLAAALTLLAGLAMPIAFSAASPRPAQPASGAPTADGAVRVITGGSPSAIGSAVPRHSGSSAHSRSATTPATTTTAPPAGTTTPQIIQVGVGQTPTSDPLPAGFLGFSTEFGAIHDYIGRDPKALNPVFLQLLRGLDQGTPPVLRIGGNSTDDSWLALPGVIPPPGVNFTITPDWLATVHALVRDTGTHVILGVNLAADDAQMAGAEARALIDGVGRPYVQSVEIGNEPDQYATGSWYVLPNKVVVLRRSPTYGYANYVAQFNQLRGLLPAGIRVAAGAFAGPNWMNEFDPLISGDPDVSMVTLHRYPLIACQGNPKAANYPSISNLLLPSSSLGLALSVAPYLSALHAGGRQLRIDELNSAACEGKPGVSNTFASSLWILDTLFYMAEANVDGINLHTLPGAAYAPFSFSESDGGHWSAAVQPVYYGLRMFASAFPTGARLVTDTVSNSSSAQDVQVFTTKAPDGVLRTTIVNEDPSSPAQVTLTLPAAAPTGPLAAETLTAPSLTASTGVSLGGRSFAEPTRTGTLAAPVPMSVPAQNGSYALTVAPDSAVTVTDAG